MHELQQLARTVKQVQYRQHRALETGLIAVGTTLARWDALRAVDRAPGASARELAAATFQTEQAFGALAGRLVAQGLVERRAGRGRRIPHHLTPAGRRVLEAGHRVADEVLEHCYAGLPAADRADLLALLRRVLAVADA
ncbi:MarR family winged helix-turn-helix transcriptional regulator [Micromonospora humi]|uniref:DNA-binding transcriptional regulator, MarR family n=1 Tax=Micromonospora humi TaxID=745366 RepID=A0A1C5H9L3_9ACTN|nr:MarR family winged helix-turn-helix transcriptional regulator [Micromonospora humi]SCG42694.1 DNA-binding transcriptional regulator, MarR family [Micromonospora humi]